MVKWFFLTFRTPWTMYIIVYCEIKFSYRMKKIEFCSFNCYKYRKWMHYKIPNHIRLMLHAMKCSLNWMQWDLSDAHATETVEILYQLLIWWTTNITHGQAMARSLFRTVRFMPFGKCANVLCACVQYILYCLWPHEGSNLPIK